MVQSYGPTFRCVSSTAARNSVYRFRCCNVNMIVRGLSAPCFSGVIDVARDKLSS